MKRFSKSNVLIALALLGMVGEGIYIFNRSRSRAHNSAVSAPALKLENLVPVPLSPGRRDALRPELRDALGLGEQIPGGERIELLRTIGGEFSAEESQALLAALYQPKLPHDSEQWHAAYFHQIALLLWNEKRVNPEFARTLASVARDPGHSREVRDYALQHLRQVWVRSTPYLRSSIEATFRDLVTNDAVLSASALLSLHLLGTGAGEAFTGRASSKKPASGSVAKSPVDPGSPMGHPSAVRPAFYLTDSEMIPLVQAILDKPSSSQALASRMTAIRIVADRRLSAFKADLGRIAADAVNEHAVVRMSAVAALSSFAAPDDRSLLESLDRQDPRIDRAVQAALANFR